MASLSFPPTPSVRLPMYQSVELLRGHRERYGKSAQGGIINIVTQQPDSTPRGYIEGGAVAATVIEVSSTWSGPIQDGLLYGSVTLLRRVDDGDMINPRREAMT